MSERRRRDGELEPVDGEAQAVGPRSNRVRQRRPQPDGEPGPVADAAAPRVRGAWSTPAVVVRRPDGSIVTRDGADGAGADVSSPAGRRGRAGAGAAPGGVAASGSAPRVRPRRIPGAPGAVLLIPTLTKAADGREARRRRRGEATASPLPPRPNLSARAKRARSALRPVAGRSTTSAGGDSVGGAPARGRLSPRRASAGAPRSGSRARHARHVLRAVSGLSFERLLPGDDEARARRSARLRRVGMVFAAIVLVGVMIYAVFPVRTGLDLRSSTDRARERLAAFQRENELLEQEARELQEDQRIEEEARALGLVLPGEESYGIMPAPEAPPSGSTPTTRPAG